MEEIDIDVRGGTARLCGLFRRMLCWSLTLFKFAEAVSLFNFIDTYPTHSEPITQTPWWLAETAVMARITSRKSQKGQVLCQGSKWWGVMSAPELLVVQGCAWAQCAQGHRAALGLLHGRVEEWKNRKLSTAGPVCLAAFFCLISQASVWPFLCVFWFIIWLFQLSPLV